MNTAALLIGFGGPTTPEGVKPFLQSVLEGTRIPEERIREVERHYQVIGGSSPFNAITYRQKEALERYFQAKNLPLPVEAAFRHSDPGFTEVFAAFKKKGIKKVIGFVLASFRSSASREKYIRKVDEARAQAGALEIEMRYTEGFENHPLYLRAQTERVRESWDHWPAEKKAATFILFTAHSIPAAMCEKSCAENGGRCYGSQFHEAAYGISRSLAFAGNWAAAYQSRSGSPQDPWLEPDVKGLMGRIDARQFHNVLFIPVGFLCDNVEVIYDLDVEAKALVESRGMRYHRAGTVSDHPKFIEMMGSQILEKL